MTSEVLHAVLTHHEPSYPQTLEAGIVKVADALDMEKGRARIPYQEGRLNIHSISALAISETFSVNFKLLIMHCFFCVIDTLSIFLS